MESLFWAKIAGAYIHPRVQKHIGSREVELTRTRTIVDSIRESRGCGQGRGRARLGNRFLGLPDAKAEQHVDASPRRRVGEVFDLVSGSAASSGACLTRTNS